jgi:hypothetical protein
MSVEFVSSSKPQAFGSFLRCFESVASADESQVRELWIELAGRPVQLRVVGAVLAEVLATAYRHLLIPEQPAGSAVLQIDLWDEAATLSERPVRYLRDGLDRSWPFGRAVLAESADGRVLGYQSHGLVGILDLKRSRLVGSVPDSDRLSLFERGKPLQPLLFAWLGSIGATPVHAGFVAKQGKGLLLGGAGGSGKSTTSLLAWNAGFDYLGDDYIALPEADDAGRHFGHSLYTSTWLTPEHSLRFPRLAEKAHIGHEGEDKVLVLLNEVSDQRLVSSAEVRALVLPRVIGGFDSRYRPAKAAEAVLRLAPSSILQLPFIAGRPALDRMHELVQNVPSFWLDLGTDFDSIAATLDAIHQEVSS